jgi:carbon-monoxide dehydrogenase medium subunit
MKPPRFDYYAPTDIDAALALFAELGEEARYLAGGQSLVPMMNFRVAAPTALIDLNRVAGMSDVGTEADGGLRLGAMVRTRRIETDPAIAAASPLLAAAAAHVAHVQIRNRGTIGGSIAHADPAAEFPGIVVACDAEIRLRGPDGGRAVPATDFFEGVFATAVGDGELVAEIVFPRWPADRRWAFRELARRDGDFALVGIAAWIDLDADGAVDNCGLAAIGAGDTPRRLPSAEAALKGEIPSPETFTAAAVAAAGDLEPGSDIHASAEYRREVGGVLVERTLREAWERAA